MWSQEWKLILKPDGTGFVEHAHEFQVLFIIIVTCLRRVPKSIVFEKDSYEFKLLGKTV